VHGNGRQASDPLAHRTCEQCHQATRFVGLESAPHDANADLCTYECDTCGHLQTEIIPLTAFLTNGARVTH